MLRVAQHIRSPSTRFVCTPCRNVPQTAALRAGAWRYKSTKSSAKPPSKSPNSTPTPSTPVAATPSSINPPVYPIGSREAHLQNPDLARYIKDLSAHADAPDLMVTDPFLDVAEVYNVPPTKDAPYENQVIIRNDELPLFQEYDKILEELGEEPEPVFREDRNVATRSYLPYNYEGLSRLYRRTLNTRRVTVQTGKGKIHRHGALTIVGDGAGLVGLGHAKSSEMRSAVENSFVESVRSMDYIERFENRTVWTELTTKFGSTRVILRPRPIGFGLRCNPYIHEILTVAGIKDCSAKVWGSRNPFNVIMATFRILQPGSYPLGMGDGIGGSGSRREKGVGMRSAGDVERERGRRLAGLRTV